MLCPGIKFTNQITIVKIATRILTMMARNPIKENVPFDIILSKLYRMDSRKDFLAIISS
jgi:hypothetical protein